MFLPTPFLPAAVMAAQLTTPRGVAGVASVLAATVALTLVLACRQRRVARLATGREDRLTSILQLSSDLITVHDPTGRVLEASPAAGQVLGLEAADLIGVDLDALIHPADLVHAREAFGRALHRPDPGAVIAFRVAHADGAWVHVESTGRRVSGHGSGDAVVIATRDVTERRRATEELRFQAHRLARRAAQQAAVAELGEEALRTHDLEGVRNAAARTVSRTLGVALDQVGFVAADLPVRRAGARHVVPVGGHDAPHGHLIVEGDHAADLPSDERDFLQSVANVVAAAADQESMRHELEHDALHDRLTGVANRTLLLDRIEHLSARAARQAHRFGVFCIDLDAFKDVNDAFGHLVGDHLLRDVADRLRDVLRPLDTVARIGADEFAVLVEDVADAEAATVVAQRLREALRPAFSSAGAELAVTASIGFTLGGPDADGARLLREADAAVHRAKELGRDRIEHFADGLRQRARRRIDLAARLRSALDHGEIRVRYQPVTDLRTGDLVGVEALARWGEDDTAVSPAEFIPVAEETGLIVTLGAYVLDEACQQGRTWTSGSDEPFTIAVNVSSRELTNSDLPSSVRATLERTGLAPDRLTLELTETAFAGEPEAARAVFERLHRLGVRLAIDDFGTGYSSLSYLRRLPFDIIKLDRSFVAGVATSPHDLAIVSGTIDLAHQLGLTAIGEGVETVAQRQQLAGLGCDLAQGFLWSPAVSAGVITRQLAQQRRRRAESAAGVSQLHP